GIGEGHLLHQASRRLRSDILPNLEVLFRVSLSELSDPPPARVNMAYTFADRATLSSVERLARIRASEFQGVVEVEGNDTLTRCSGSKSLLSTWDRNSSKDEICS
ncbi:hypothetical protein, partial [Pseudomonas putida]|uniref:hypothetical protein n=1 Tax=Pseudomonas putida TaxID=303 RepID=UPI001364B65A